MYQPHVRDDQLRPSFSQVGAVKEKGHLLMGSHPVHDVGTAILGPEGQKTLAQPVSKKKHFYKVAASLNNSNSPMMSRIQSAFSPRINL